MGTAELESIAVRLSMPDDLKRELLALEDSRPIVDVIDRVGRAPKETRWSCTTKQHIQAVMDFCWEKLNSGYWKDVPVAWRKLYSHSSLLLAACILSGSEKLQPLKNTARWKAALAACDMGILMGYPIQDNVLSRLANRLNCLLGQQQCSSPCNPADSTNSSNSNKKRRLHSSSDEDLLTVLREPCITYSIDHSESPSLEHFKSTYMETRTPVIIVHSIDHWPAFGERQWSTAYLKMVSGYRTIPVEVGARYTDDSWSQSLMTVSEFIDRYVIQVDETQPKGYLAQHQLFDQIPELRRDICIPDYCCLSTKATERMDKEEHEIEKKEEDIVINAWFGPCGTVSPLHHDQKHNLLAQVVGSKYIRLYGEEQTPRLYPHEGTVLFNTSQVDVECPDFQQFPEFKEAQYTECILREGQMLYIPPGCWHFVKSLSLSFSVSFWWC
jgi:lysine-specific demethylase 8